MDRDDTIHDHWQQYLGLPGAKAVRLRAGWAKGERQPSVYDSDWSDAIIEDVLAESVQAWL